MTGPWPVPVEIITRLASPTGISFILRAKLRNAVFKPLGRISVRADRYVGEIDFVEPIGAERQDGLVVMLGIAPGEALTYEVAP